MVADFRRMALASLLLLPILGHADPGCLRFDSQAIAFSGTPQQQAACLLRYVPEMARLGKAPADLPEPLLTLAGTKVSVKAEALRAFLKAQGISEPDLGGSLNEPLARANSNAADAPEANYFVIHDTSTPKLGTAPFPADMDGKDWSFNTLSHYKRGPLFTAPGCVSSPHPETQPVSHVVINRLGESVSPVDFSTPWRATKFESEHDCRAKGLFLHVELVQPRRSDTHEGRNNDYLAPQPGFTAGQYRRLALVYVAASVRKGVWLVPSFHAPLDEGIPNGHDDPQHFELATWAQALAALLREIQEPAR